MVLATDEVYTYAIYNYAELQWTTHTEAGGDTTAGEGGTPAFVRTLLFLTIQSIKKFMIIFRLVSTLETAPRAMSTFPIRRLRPCAT